MATTQRAAWIAAVAVLVSCNATVSDAQERASESAAALRLRGLQLGYNLDHADALATFKQAIAADPEDPAAYRLVAATVWIELLFEQGAITVDDYLGQARANLQRAAPNPALDAAFHESITRALSLSEERLRTHPQDADAHYQVGAACGYLASYTATVEGRLVGSVSPGRRAYREHARTMELDPARKDAGLSVGMYRYAVASLPVPLRLMAHLAGFGGDRERGLRMVEEAARYPSDAQPNALFTLMLLYNREERFDDAFRLIGELQERFPRNRLLWLEAGNTALRAGRAREANIAIENGMARLAGDARPKAFEEYARWRYAHGAALVALKNGTAAERELQRALGDAAHDWVKGRIHKELGKTADLRGDRARALEEYRLGERLCRAGRDAECSDEASKLIESPYR